MGLVCPKREQTLCDHTAFAAPRAKRPHVAAWLVALKHQNHGLRHARIILPSLGELRWGVSAIDLHVKGQTHRDDCAATFQPLQAQQRMCHCVSCCVLTRQVAFFRLTLALLHSDWVWFQLPVGRKTIHWTGDCAPEMQPYLCVVFVDGGS